MQNFEDDNRDISDKTDDNFNSSLTPELLTEDEKNYFSGQKKKTTSKKSVLFPKRNAVKTASTPTPLPNYDSVNAITESIASAKDQPDNQSNSQSSDNQIDNKASNLLNKEGSSLQIIIGSIIMVLLVSAAVLFTLKSTDHLPTFKNIPSAENAKPPVPSTDTPIKADEASAITDKALDTTNANAVIASDASTVIEAIDDDKSVSTKNTANQINSVSPSSESNSTSANPSNTAKTMAVAKVGTDDTVKKDNQLGCVIN